MNIPLIFKVYSRIGNVTISLFFFLLEARRWLFVLSRFSSVFGPKSTAYQRIMRSQDLGPFRPDLKIQCDCCCDIVFFSFAPQCCRNHFGAKNRRKIKKSRKLWSRRVQEENQSDILDSCLIHKMLFVHSFVLNIFCCYRTSNIFG